jgi:RES domain-containing protein
VLATEPLVVPFRQKGWHRLIPSQFSHDLPANEAEIINRLDGSTDDSVQAQRRGLIGINVHELVFGLPHAEVINDAFCCPGKDGNRFNDSTRGAWYAAEQIETSIAEVAFHKARRLAQVIVPNTPHGRPQAESSSYDDWLADFEMEIHSLEPPDDFADCLKAEPIPACYTASQALANRLLKQGANGILYPSVRRKDHQCLACFRPALVHTPRRAKRIEITLESIEAGYQLLPFKELELPRGNNRQLAQG